MKKYFCLFAVIILLLAGGCSKEAVTNQPEESASSGSMLFKLNKSEIPSGVTVVTASLIRQGFSTLSATLNILTDSTADLTMQNITAGVWHLVIEAKNNSGTVLFKGETDVNVAAGVITQVSLVLQPTNTNVGSIYISVRWGSQIPQSGWINYAGNPILSGVNSIYDPNGITRPNLFSEGNAYKIWFTNCGAGNVGTISYAISTDGISWNRPATRPLLLNGAPGSWDAGSVAAGPMIKIENLYYMYFAGKSSNNAPTSIGVATSTDGINWVKAPAPVLIPQGGVETSLDPGEVIKIGNTYYMYYSRTGTSGNSICTAISSDGLNWQRTGTPVLSGSKTWEYNGVYMPSVIKYNNKYLMCYQNGSDNTGFGLATSTDGINWVKDDANPFFTNSNIGSSSSIIQYPIIREVNSELRVYYAIFNSSLNYRTINFVRKVN